MGVSDLIGGDDAGTERLEAVESLTEVTPETARRHVDASSVAEDVVACLRLAQVPALLADDSHQFGLMVADGEIVGRKNSGPTRVHHRFGGDEEAVDRQSRLAGVL